MPSDETRRLLKIFGVAVTSYEDLVKNGASTEQIKETETEVFDRLSEIRNHLERLRAGAKAGA
jgi:hypothetical protein